MLGNVEANRSHGDASASLAEPPLRFPAGADAVATVEKKAHDLLAQVARGCSFELACVR